MRLINSCLNPRITYTLTCLYMFIHLWVLQCSLVRILLYSLYVDPSRVLPTQCQASGRLPSSCWAFHLERPRRDHNPLRCNGPNTPGWWYSYPSEKDESQLGWLFPIYGKMKNVPNHQPDTELAIRAMCLDFPTSSLPPPPAQTKT